MIKTDNGTIVVGTNIEFKDLFLILCKPDEALANYLTSEAI